MSENKVIDFQTEAIGRLRSTVARLGEQNEALLAYARGHSGATAQIHAAVLCALEAGSFEHLAHIITQDWVDILGLDAVGLALIGGQQGLRLGATGLQLVDPAQVGDWFPGRELVALRSVDAGSAIFGPAAPLVRSEALVRLSLGAPLPEGLLALGSRHPHNFDGVGGSELLQFLGGVVCRLLTRFLIA